MLDDGTILILANHVYTYARTMIFNRVTHVMHSAAIAVATWLSVRHMPVLYVSKRLNLS